MNFFEKIDKFFQVTLVGKLKIGLTIVIEIIAGLGSKK